METYIIAEIAQAHDGSLGIAHSYIEALKGTGVNAVKFQTHIAEAESSTFEPFRVKFSYEDKTRYDYWKRMEFSTEDWIGLKKHCDDAGVEFISSPFSNAAVDLLEKAGVSKYKIGSGEVTNFLLLEKVAKTGKEIILSSGLSPLRELAESIQFLNGFRNKLSLLQCTTEYPAKPESWGLNQIAELKSYFNLPVGFSDHSGNIYAGLAAAAVGADILEFHVVFDKKMFGPDSMASITIDEVNKLTEGVKQINSSISINLRKEFYSPDGSLKKMFEKSLSVNKDLPEGHIIEFSDLEAKKPRDYGIDAKLYKGVIGKRLNKCKNKWEFLREEDLSK